MPVLGEFRGVEQFQIPEEKRFWNCLLLLRIYI